MLDNIEWKIPISPLLLQFEEIHLWLADLSSASKNLMTLKKYLSADEILRAKSFAFQNLEEKFIVARGILRNILSRYCNLRPEELIFAYLSHGKPQLTPMQNSLQLRFNLSHAQNYVLYAVVRECEIGVDLEWINRDLAALEIAQRFFSTQEYELLKQLQENQQIPEFFNCWTRKEAFIKATGEGLYAPLHDFSVCLPSSDGMQYLEVVQKSAQFWYVHSIGSLPNNFAAAMAVAGKNIKNIHHYIYQFPNNM